MLIGYCLWSSIYSLWFSHLGGREKVQKRGEKFPSPHSLPTMAEEQNRPKEHSTSHPTTSSVSSMESMFEESMQCNICYRPPRQPPVFMCENGHIMDEACAKRVQHCGVCRNKNIGIRNRPIEEFLNKQAAAGKKFKCQNHSLGCQEEKTLAEIQKHEEDCQFRVVPCPGFHYNKCTFQGPYNSLVAHIIKFGCCILVNLEETMQSRHNYPQLPGQDKLFRQKQAILWRPVCYTSEKNKPYAYLNVRRESTGKWMLSCHSFLPEDRMKFAKVKFSVGTPPVTTCLPTGSALPDHLAPADKRPTISHLHPTALRITCPRPTRIDLVVKGGQTPETHVPSPIQGLCVISVGSHLIAEPEDIKESEESFTYDGKMLPVGGDPEAIRKSGRFLGLEDEQIKHLGAFGSMFHVVVSFGVVMNLKQQARPSTATSSAQPTAGQAAEEATPPPAKKRFLDKVPLTQEVLATKVIIPWKNSVGLGTTKREPQPQKDEETVSTTKKEPQSQPQVGDDFPTVPSDPTMSIMPILSYRQPEEEQNMTMLEAIRKLHYKIHSK